MRSRLPALAVAAASLFSLSWAAPALSTEPSARAGAAAKATTNACPPDATVQSYSDGLDKLVRGGVEVGGLSSLDYDPGSKAFVTAVDRQGSEPARIWFFSTLTAAQVTRDPLVLRKPDGTPYTGANSDNEGLAVLNSGSYLVSSETEPSIRIFDRSGVQTAQLPVPARFAVKGTTSQGQATENGTLEGLTISPDGHEIVAAMELALSGDVSAGGDGSYHRFLVYDWVGATSSAAGHWALTEQLGYRAGPGMRIPEVSAYGAHGLLVDEASYSSSTGNTVNLYAVPDLRSGPDISGVANLSQAPRDVLPKTLIANLVQCPTLGATSKGTQANPLMDNYEGMNVTGAVAQTVDGAGKYRVSLISDDNFSSTQTTRVLNLTVDVPGY